MLRIYLDTNVYYISHLNPDTNSRRVITKAIEANFAIIQSDYLYDEVISLFRRELGKDVASKQRLLMLSIPHIEVISKFEWGLFIQQYTKYVRDIDDLPHICSYFAGDASRFVTTNRRLTQMKVHQFVEFRTPKGLLDELGYECLDTVNGV